jgi:hypothetical protein
MLNPSVFRSFLVLVLVGFWSLAHSHPNGTSKITLTIVDPDSLTFHVDVNRDDVTNAMKESQSILDLPKSDYPRLMKKGAYYLQSRLQLMVDGKGVATLQPVAWDSAGLSDTALIDSATILRGTWVITYATKIPQDSKKLTLGVQFFLEFGVQPLSEVTILWHDKLVKKVWLTTDKMVSVPLNRDSLAAWIARDSLVSQSGTSANVEGGWLRFISLGFTHIVPHGLDHILFVLGLFFFSTLLRPLLWQITAFTVAHSLTLGLSLMGYFTLPPKIVEPLIALSIAVVALENIFYRKFNPSRWLIVFGFGLVHGLGFAGILHQFGIPKGEFWTTLIGFNLGVELGQISLVLVAAAVTFPFWKKPWYFKAVVVPISAGIAIIGLYWAIERAISL